MTDDEIRKLALEKVADKTDEDLIQFCMRGIRNCVEGTHVWMDGNDNPRNDAWCVYCCTRYGDTK